MSTEENGVTGQGTPVTMQIPAPEWIVLGVNNLCNLHCKMCDVGTDYKKSNFYTNLAGTKPVNMPAELIHNVIDQTARWYPGCKLGYAFTEPLIYPHLIESLEHADRLGVYTAVTTNGLTLAGKAKALVTAGLNEIFISLDGPPEIHNFIRGNNKSFQRAFEGIDTLLDLNNPPSVSVYCVITEWNIGYLTAFVEIFRHVPLARLGFMHMNFTPGSVVDSHNMIYGGHYPATESNVAEINIGNMDLDRLWREIERVMDLDYPFPVVFSPGITTRERLELYYKAPEIKFGKQCRDIFRNIMIKSDGTAIPAHGRCYNLAVGNIYQQDLKAIWNSGVFTQFRKTVTRAGGLLPACSRCCSAFG